MSVYLTPDYIQSVVERDNLVVRNLQVTQGYYRLSNGMRRCTGGSNVSWCSFATHASKTAGQALRHELMPGFLKSAMIRMAGYDNTFLLTSQSSPSTRTTMSSGLQMIYRKIYNKKLFLIAPIHHHFEAIGWPETKVTARFWIIGLVFAVVGVAVGVVGAG